MLTDSSSIIGPSLGGALAQPHQSWPTLFPRGSLFDHYPFLLPNLICFLILLCGIIVGVLFLEETHAARKHKRDLGLIMGRWVVNRVCKKQYPVTLRETEGDADALESLLDEGVPPPEYRTTENTPRQSSSAESGSLDVLEKQSPPKPRTFTRQIILLIVNYGILA